MAVVAYFKDESNQLRALDACKEFLGGRDWAVKDRLKLYDSSREAFGENKSAGAFRRIYDELVLPAPAGGWGIARNASGPLWSSEKTFETLKSDFSRFAWGSVATLPNFREEGSDTALLPLFEKMRTFKPVTNWPVMAVSKVLHFFNAELFPVYDNEVIWNRVLKSFRYEFREFCLAVSAPYDTGDTPTFYRNYMLWGSALLRSAHPRFMQQFAEWLGQQNGADLARRPFDPSRLYATAFEYTVIGAYADLAGVEQGVAGVAAHCKAG